MSSAVSADGRAASAAARQVIHVINPLWDAKGGSDWRAIEMYRTLGTANTVRLWSPFVPAPIFRERYRVELIRPWENKLAFFLPSEREPRLSRLGSLGDAFDPTPSRRR
jgi:hypothetical protein